MTILRTSSATTIRESSMRNEEERDCLISVSKNDTHGGEEENSDDEDCGILNAMMQRGAYLRMLRQMEMEDEAERQRQATEIDGIELKDCGNTSKGETDCSDTASLSHVASLSSLSTAGGDESTTIVITEDLIDIVSSSEGLQKFKILQYDSFLAHQRYYDDLKHANVDFIDYGMILDSDGRAGGRLVIEQRKSLGKGGLCWDAAFILAEYMIAHEKDWNRHIGNGDSIDTKPTKVVELGSGTGLGGLMIAKAIFNCHVTVTDLPELVDLMSSNITRNFGRPISANEKDQKEDDPISSLHLDNLKDSRGNPTAKQLRWGVKEDYGDGPFDVIFGADVVTSLYDPIALAHTLHDLSHETTKIYVSVKSRLNKPHELFEGEMKRLFEKVEVMRNIEESRNKNPDTAIIVAEGLKR